MKSFDLPGILMVVICTIGLCLPATFMFAQGNPTQLPPTRGYWLPSGAVIFADFLAGDIEGKGRVREQYVWDKNKIEFWNQDEVNYELIFVAPNDESIESVANLFCESNSSQKQILVLLSSGTVYSIRVDLDTRVVSYQKIPNIPSTLTLGFRPVKNIIGDDLYALVGEEPVVLRDTAKGPWKLNTAGLPTGRTLGNMVIDSLQNVWLVCNNQLYMQPLISGTWNLVNSLGGIYRVFTDRFQKIWIARTAQLAYSLDSGNSFIPGPSGLGSNESAIVGLSTDFNGDIYILTSSGYLGPAGGNKIFRSRGGTEPFIRIDQNLATKFSPGANAQIYTGILADSGLLVSNQAGLHFTNDSGTTWQYIPGPPSPQVFGVVATNDDSLVMTTPAGLFKGNRGIWSRKFPDTTFRSGVEVFRDTNGVIYAKAEKLGMNNSGGSPRYVIYKSNDNGNHFTADSAGLGFADVGMNGFYVDEAGVQHAGGNKYEAGLGGRLFAWKKEPGQPWTADNNGIPALYNLTVWSVTGDGQGTLNFCYLGPDGPRNYARALSGNTWAQVGGLFNQQVQDETGKPGTSVFAYAGMVNFMQSAGLTKKVGNTYSTIPLPAGITNASVGNVRVAFDASGALWAWFEKMPAGFPPPPGPSVGSGLYYTTDLLNWQKPANDMDTVLFSTLRAIGDSVFAISRNNAGVYIFKKKATVTIYTFTGNGNWSDAGNWTNGLVPPATLPSGSEIIIDPAGSGVCVLNVNQIIAPGAKLTVKQPKQLIVPGNLLIQKP